MVSKYMRTEDAH